MMMDKMAAFLSLRRDVLKKAIVYYSIIVGLSVCRFDAYCNFFVDSMSVLGYHARKPKRSLSESALKQLEKSGQRRPMVE